MKKKPSGNFISTTHEHEMRVKEKEQQEEKEKEFQQLKKDIKALKAEKNKIHALKKQDNLSKPLKVLLFDYLGFLAQLDFATNIQQANLLSKLFNVEKPETIRKVLSGISKSKTRKNLKIIHDILNDLSDIKALEKVTLDIKKIIIE